VRNSRTPTSPSVVATAPLHFGQLSVWRAQQAIPVDRWPEYNLLTMWRLPAGATTAAVARALHALTVRHESLRTHFDLPARRQQIMHPPPAVDLPVRVGTADADDARRTEAYALATDLANVPYQLDTGPGWRAAALTDAAGRPTYLALSLHHAVADGWAIDRLRAELLDHIEAGTDLLATPPSPPPQPRELALEQQSALWQQVRQATRRYWKRLFDEIGPADGVAVPDNAGRIEARLYSGDALVALSAAARRTGLPPATVALALTAVFVSAVQARGQGTLTLVSNNRFAARWQPLVSSMSQNLPFPARVASPDEDLTAFGRRLYAAAVRGYRYSSYDVDEFAEYATRRRGGRFVHDNYFNYTAAVTAEAPRARPGGTRPSRVEPMDVRRTTGPRVYVKVFDELDELIVDIRVDPRLADVARLHRILWWYHDELARLAGGEVSRLGDMVDRCP